MQTADLIDINDNIGTKNTGGFFFLETSRNWLSMWILLKGLFQRSWYMITTQKIM